MGLVIIVVLGALGLGVLRGGSLSRLGALELRRRWLVAVGAGVQLAGALAGRWGLPVRASYAVGLVTSAVLALAFCTANRHVRGVGLCTLGLAVNALVVAINGGAMPVSLAALARTGGPAGPVDSGADARHVLAGAHSSLRWLGDGIPVPLPLRPEVVSPGDIFVAAGLVQLVVVAMGPKRPGREPSWSPAPTRPARATPEPGP